MIPWPGRIQLRIGAPLTFSDYPTDKSSIERISHELRRAVVALAP